METPKTTYPKQPRRARWVVAISSLLSGLAFSVSGAAFSQDSGYFSGLRLTAPNGKSDAWNQTAPGLKLGQALEFIRNNEFTQNTTASSTAFGGYRFVSGISLGASISSSDSRNTPDFAASAAGLGLRFDGARFGETRNASVNVDVVSAFSLRNSVSVYGKVGVGRSETRIFETPVVATSPEKTAISYGVGVRYDVTPSVGLKLELSRGTRFGLDRLRTESEPDSINFGLRWSF
jgi:opacity protein-like surface antigen